MKMNAMVETDKPANRGQNRLLQKFGRFYTLPIEMAVAVLAPALAGQWLDARTGKEPWFTVAGMVLGGAAAVRSAYRAMTESLGAPDSDEAASGSRSEQRESPT